MQSTLTFTSYLMYLFAWGLFVSTVVSCSPLGKPPDKLASLPKLNFLSPLFRYPRKCILVPRAYDLLVSGWIVGPGNSRYRMS